MSTHNAIYIRATDPKTVAAIKKKYRKAHTEAGSEFYCVPKHDDDFEVPEKDMTKLSAQLKTDIIWLSFQSVSDSFQFHHWRDGQRLRSLVYQCFEGPGWERAEGDAEPWEEEAFFPAHEEQSYLKYATSVAEKKEIKRVFREHSITAGQEIPGLDAKNTAWDIGLHYRLPGWSPQVVKGVNVPKRRK